jgi:transcriptional antiterminator RfaH
MGVHEPIEQPEQPLAGPEDGPDEGLPALPEPGRLDTPPPPPAQIASPAWFCVRSQPKHEHIAAAGLRQEPDVEVYLPRIRFKRPTRQGHVWVTEALFPCYVFAKFDWLACLRKVHHARGVRGVVHFRDRWPTIPDAVIADLRAHLGHEQVHQLEPDLQPGDEVQIQGGAFEGLRAVIERPMPGKERVAVLMDFLGRQTSVQVERRWVVLQKEGRRIGL